MIDEKALKLAVETVRAAGLYVEADGYNVGESYTIREVDELQLWIEDAKLSPRPEGAGPFIQFMRARARARAGTMSETYNHRRRT